MAQIFITCNKQDFLDTRRELQMVFLEIDTYFKDLPMIKSISAINPERNIRLNRLELLILLLNPEPNGQIQDRMLNARRVVQTIQSMHNIRIDYLLLSIGEFFDLLKSDERNPAKISEADLTYNLARFSHREMGTAVREGHDICVEYIASSILMRKDARRTEAIPIILAKAVTNYNVLIFLSRKYGLSDRLLGLLKILNKLKPKKEIQQAIRTMEGINIKEIKANEKSIKQKMRLYDVIR